MPSLATSYERKNVPPGIGSPVEQQLSSPPGPHVAGRSTQLGGVRRTCTQAAVSFGTRQSPSTPHARSAGHAPSLVQRTSQSRKLVEYEQEAHKVSSSKRLT